MNKFEWHSVQGVPSKKYTCGHCGNQLASEKGFNAKVNNSNQQPLMYVCHFCDKPTFFDVGEIQHPKPKVGSEVSGIDDQSVKDLYNEARDAAGAGAATAAIMACRVILMHIAVAKKAKKGKSFEYYVDFLNDQGYVPKGLENWAHEIHKMGNKVNHKIIIMNDEQAKNILKFTGTLLKIIYEMPQDLKNVGQNSVKPKLEIQQSKIS